MSKTYDFIVCGGGTSGCVVAARLAERTDASVLLLEAGGDERVPSVEDARLWMANIGTERDWNFRAEPHPALNGRRPPLPMGKVLGGGSSVNGLVWARGHRHDFEVWAAETGDPGWNYASVLALYKRMEDWQGPPDEHYRGRGGPVHVALPQNPVPITSALMQATDRFGIPRVEDLNARTMEAAGGCGIPNVTVRDGHRRVSMASAYLRPQMDRPNLTVLLAVEVDHLVLSGSRVTGVAFTCRGRDHVVSATQEVILSLGAIQTPRVLMMSGIGDEGQLARHGIDVVQHLPGVGRNFQDHILLAGCVWEYRKPEPPRNNAAEFTFFCKSDDALPAPDLQPVLEECGFGSEVTHDQYNVPVDPSLAWTLAPGLVRPQSRGHLELTGATRSDPIRIHANFLSEPADMVALTRALEICREIGNAPELAPFVRREVMPGNLKGPALETFIRNAAGTYFHQTCTAKMGTDPMSVVSGSLDVYGIDCLRIADGSVMPAITTGNTMAPCALIGERAAELIINAYARPSRRPAPEAPRTLPA